MSTLTMDVDFGHKKPDDHRISSQPVAEIVKYAPQGIKSKKALAASFNKIYAELLEQQKEEFAKTWKDRLNSKLNEIIKVKRVKEEAPEFEEDKVLYSVRIKIAAIIFTTTCIPLTG